MAYTSRTVRVYTSAIFGDWDTDIFVDATVVRTNATTISVTAKKRIENAIAGYYELECEDGSITSQYLGDHQTVAITHSYTKTVTGAAGTTTITCDENTSPAVAYDAAEYTISYNANGGTGAPASQTKTYGVNITLSTGSPTRTGYNFLGWATSSGAATAAYQPGGTYSSNGDVTLYAVWQLITYTVSYNANGGTGAPASQTKEYNVPLALAATVPTRTGYTFKGWATSSTGSVQFQPGATYITNASITLYAVWQVITYQITYSANGGSGAPAGQTKTYGVNLTLSTTRPTRTGYNFVKWNTESDGTGTDYNPGGTYSANAAATLYAIWTIITYTVSYNANGGTGAPASQTKNYGQNLVLSTTQPTRSGYQFYTWNTKADGTGAFYGPGSTYSANAAVTLYAVWKKLYSISFNANGGTGAPAAVSGTSGSYVTLPSATPTKASTSDTFTVTYNKVNSSSTISKSSETVTVTTKNTFLRWNTNSNGTGISYAPGASFKVPEGNTTLYAIFGQSKSGSATLPTGTLTQYVLSGWSESTEDIQYVSDPYTPIKNVTLYAIWSPVSTGGYLKFPASFSLNLSQGDKVFITGFHNYQNDGPYTVDTYSYSGGVIEMTFVEDFPYEGSQNGAMESLRIFGAGSYVPDMDYICSLNNRLWGCSSKMRTIYASALGDPSDFYTFAGDSLDAFQVAVGSGGDFTGCAAMNNNVLFFKQHVIHKILGGYPAEYTLYTYDLDGASYTNGLASVNANGDVIFVSEHGIGNYQGSTAGIFSKELGEGNMNNAIAMFNGEQYFLHYNQDDLEHKTYIYDTRYNVWVEADYHEVLAFAHLRDHDYVLIRNNEALEVKIKSQKEVLWEQGSDTQIQLIDQEDNVLYDSDTTTDPVSFIDTAGTTLWPIEKFYGTIYQIDSGDPADGEWEILFKPFLEILSGTWGSKSHMFEKKRYTGITFRLELPAGSWIKAEIKADDGRWVPVARKAGRHNGVDDFVVRTPRTDKIQLRLSGHGPMTILAMEREYTVGSRR